MCRTYCCYLHLLKTYLDDLSKFLRKYRVSIKSFPDYKYLLQENYVEYKNIFLM